MSSLSVFNNVSLDGYFTDRNGSMQWAYQAENDKEWTDFVSQNASSGGILLFGRVTYQMMESYWPTPEAKKNNPTVAENMNRMPKFVFSKTLKSVSWENTTLLNGNPVQQVREIKGKSSENITILGSGNLVSQLAGRGLIDEYQFVVNSVVLGAGRTLFEGITESFRLKLRDSRAFKNGNVLLSYRETSGN